MLYNIFQYSLGVLALISFAMAFLLKGKRGVMVWTGISAAFAGVSAHYHVFWSFSVFTLMVPWSLFCAGDWIDFNWRFRTGFCVFLVGSAALCIYPTFIDERYDRPDSDKTLTEEQQAEVDTKARGGDMGFGRFLRSNVPFRLVRGLDLKGGLRLVYNVDVQEAVKDKRDRYFDILRGELARAYGLTKDTEVASPTQLSKLGESVRVEKAKDDVGLLTVTFQNAADSAKINDAFLKKFVGELNVIRGDDKAKVSFRIKQEVEADIRKNAVEQAKDTVLRRVDSLGLKEAAVSNRDEDIIVEVPGSDERAFKGIKDIIAETARLEFKMVDDEMAGDPKWGGDYFASIQRAGTELPKGLRFGFEQAPVGPGKSRPVTVAHMIKGEGESMNDTLKRLQDWAATLPIDQDHQIGFQKDLDYDNDTDKWEEVGWRTFFLFTRADVTGDMISSAEARSEQGESGIPKWVVSMEFTPIGAQRFEDVTGANIEKRFAIILDDRVENAPVIKSKIGGGSGQITMGAGSQQKQLEDSKKLALVLKSGALPAPIAMSNQQIIGPSLGADAIFQGVKGAAAGGLLVLILMLTIYSRAGFIANVAVLFNLVLQVAILAMLGASMTLPGIAGLALTIGIAVDANVLINERIRDELRAGKSARSAVDIGYDRAFTAILDGHVTTFISGLILWQYGSGPIKGFAVTLIVGVVVSLFTGVVCTRLMFDWAVRWRKVKKLSLG